MAHGVAGEKAGTYDLIIIGGGIHGAALLWEAASRGLHALLLEQEDFGSATSANSLKIIHGGIRYLQDFDIPRLRVAARERGALLRIAPHLVEPLTCIMPTFRSLARGRFAIRGAFALYDLLTMDCRKGLDPQRRIAGCRLLSREEFLRYLPWLDTPEVSGGACWQDARAWNTERLVLAFVLSAVSAGAVASNYTRAEHLLMDAGRVTGVAARDIHSDMVRIVSAPLVVDCRGPWQGAPLAPGAGLSHPRFARAYNLLLRRPLAGIAFGVQAPLENGSRLLFCTPWRGGSIVGTWYDRRQVSPDDLSLDEADISMCLAQVNRALPGIDLKREEVMGIHVGLLPCTAEDDGRTGEPRLEKQHRILQPAPGLILVQGVKYTTARFVAEEVVNSHVAPALGRRLPPSRTRTLPLYGGDIEDMGEWQNEIVARYGARFPRPVLERLMRNYGSRLTAIMHLVEENPALGEYIAGMRDTIQAEVVHAVTQEQAQTLSDVLLRRTDMGSLGPLPQETLRHCCRIMAPYLGWDVQRQDAEIRANEVRCGHVAFRAGQALERRPRCEGR